MSPKPARQICPIHTYDDDVKTSKVDDWVMVSEEESHPPFEWPASVPLSPRPDLRSGIGVELGGVYDDLLDGIDPDTWPSVPDSCKGS